INIQCIHCGALHFRVEKKSRNNEFDQCCSFGNVRVSLHIPPYCVGFSKEISRNVENSGQISETTTTHLLWLLYRRKFHFLEDQVPIASVCMGKSTIPCIVWRRLSMDPNHMHNCIFLDSEQACRERLAHPANRGCSRATMLRIQQGLNLVNPFIHSFKMMAEVIAEEEQKAVLERRPAPLIQMAGVICVQDDDAPPELRHPKQRGVTEYITEIDPLCYPLLRSKGEFGWHPELRKTGLEASRKHTRITQMEYYRYHLSVRQEFNPLLWGGKLFQQYIVDAFFRTEQNRLNYIRSHQRELRAEKYNVMADCIREEGTSRIGRRVILPP
uniref:Helitron_like_N domain-containing protein n=1 Tax=Heligmosomoides polygyrus TaxID=6339 RepID=A0A183G9U0_HELPZ